MMIPMLVITVKICGCRMFTTRIRSARKPMMTAGTIGVLVFGCTFASRSPAGRLLSRAIANIIRIVAVWTARQQTVMAIATQIRKIFPTVLAEHVEDDELQPARGDLGGVDVAHGEDREQQDQPPRRNEAITARRIAIGAVRRGSIVSSPSELAVSKPYIT